MTDTSARFALPHILPGQAQKELYHNEALALIDGALHPLAQSRGDNVPPATPAIGESWIVGGAPGGDWAGEAEALAIWTEGGWRFVAPVIGMRVWVTDEAMDARWDGSAWVAGEITGAVVLIGGDQIVGARQSAIADPGGGTTVDSEARAAIDAILSALRTHGLINS